MYLLEGAGNFEWFWWKKGRVFQRGGNYVLLVRKKMHVFARGGGNFELFWWTKKHVFFRGVGSLFSLLTRIRMYLPEEVAILKCSVEKGTCCSEGQQVCFLC